MSKKITELPASSSLDNADLLTAVDVSQPDPNLQNVQITKSNFLSQIQADVDAKIGAVSEDAAPILGGDLQSQGKNVLLTRDDDSVHGLLSAMISESGAALVYSRDGAYELDDGAIVVEAGAVTMHGNAIRIPSLAHSNPQGRQLYIADNSTLFAVDPPAPGWIATDTDSGNYDLGSGETPGPATQITGLSLNPSQQIEIGSRVDITVSLFVHLGKDGDPTDLFDKSSSIDIGFGIDGVHTGDWPASMPLSPYFAGFVVISFFFQSAQVIGTGQTIDVFCRRGNGEDDACNPWVYGAGNPGALDHELTVSVPPS